MKPRRLIVTIEVETDAPIFAIKENFDCTEIHSNMSTWLCKVHQIQTNVMKGAKKRGKAKA